MPSRRRRARKGDDAHPRLCRRLFPISAKGACVPVHLCTRRVAYRERYRAFIAESSCPTWLLSSQSIRLRVLCSRLLIHPHCPVFPPAPGWAPDEGGIGWHVNSNTDLQLSAREICEL